LVEFTHIDCSSGKQFLTELFWYRIIVFYSFRPIPVEWHSVTRPAPRDARGVRDQYKALNRGLGDFALLLGKACNRSCNQDYHAQNYQ
jgi:hypothetical protein